MDSDERLRRVAADVACERLQVPLWESEVSAHGIDAGEVSRVERELKRIGAHLRPLLPESLPDEFHELARLYRQADSEGKAAIRGQLDVVLTWAEVKFAEQLKASGYVPARR